VSQKPSSQKKVLLTHLDWNLQRLDEALKQNSTDYFKSAALQRFGHTYTMAIKSIRCFENLKEEASNTNDERCFELANQSGWTEGPPQWQEIIADFKSINQNPDKQETEAVYQKLPRYQKAFKNLYSNLQSLI
jgi:hypothetical protein